MAVSGRELSSLDFGNLIGGPLNAVVEAQAKSAITTANFIREVAFDKEGKVVNVDFSYEKSNTNGSKQEFKLTVPFLTMLPIPYIKVNEAVIEFNAKVTSTTESSSSSNFSTVVNASAGGSWWFASAKMNTKTSYQKQTSSTDTEKRTFDIHVRVNATNADMPGGTERILNMLEESIGESGGKILAIPVTVSEYDAAGAPTELIIDTNDVGNIGSGQLVFIGGTDTALTVSAFTATDNKLTLSAAPTAPVSIAKGTVLELKNS